MENFSDWFDLYDEEHIKAYKHVVNMIIMNQMKIVNIFLDWVLVSVIFVRNIMIIGKGIIKIVNE